MEAEKMSESGSSISDQTVQQSSMNTECGFFKDDDKEGKGLL